MLHRRNLSEISPNRRSPFHTRVWTHAGARLKTAFLGTFCFSRNRSALGRSVSRRATTQRTNRRSEKNQDRQMFHAGRNLIGLTLFSTKNRDGGAIAGGDATA